LDGPARGDFGLLMVRALFGGADELWGARWVDSTGDLFVGQHAARGWMWRTDDGDDAADPASILALDEPALRRLMLLSEADLIPPRPVETESPELQEGRAVLARFDAELTEALALGARVEALQAEVFDIDARQRAAQADGARRRYAALVAELGHLRLEAETLRAGAEATETDLRLVAAADTVRGAAERWRRARAALRTEWARWGDRERLDARTLAEAVDAPDQVPPELEALARRLEEAEDARSWLTRRLESLASGALDPPSHPAIMRLAHADQGQVWATAHRALSSNTQLEHQSLALGGLQAEGVSPAAAAELEAAHDAVDIAVREVERRRVPGLIGALVALVVMLIGLISFPVIIGVGVVAVIGTAVWAAVLPTRELSRRHAAEAEALKGAGVASYITFQMRRLEVNIDPKATEPLELAALEYRRAMAEWRKLAGDLAPADALALEAETREYAAKLANSRGAADEIAQVRNELAATAEPAVAKARAELIAACTPFGVDDPSLAVELVRHQAGMSAQARLQVALEQSERAESATRADLEQALTELGFAPRPVAGGAADAEIERGLRAYEQARDEAVERENARRRARPLHVVEAELGSLEARVAAERRPEWDAAALDPSGLDVDVDALRARRAQAIAEYQATYRALPDIGRLSERRDRLAARIYAMAEGTFDPSSIDVGEVQQIMLGRLAAARRVGPAGESVTVVLDEPFHRIHGDRKWALLDALEKLSASVQLVYLTDDVDVLVWARGRSRRGTMSLLEPARDAA